MRCKVCCDLPHVACFACGKPPKARHSGAVLRCALCEAPGHTARYCTNTAIGVRRIAQGKRRAA